MKNIWFISDTHFQHENILTFDNDHGNRIRPEFEKVWEMDEHMIEKWNSVVKPGDKIYHLGDVGFGNQKTLSRIIKRLRGKKRLCVGNHDKVKEVAPLFEKVYLWRIFKEYNFTCSHIPLRLDQLRKTEFNVHGHIHQNLMYRDSGPGTPDRLDERYINVCVEQRKYTPVHLDEIISLTKPNTEV